MVLLALLTGIRRSELFALRWGALDLEKAELYVRESVYKGHFSTPKTRSSYRKIPLSLQALQLVRDHKAKQPNAEHQDLVFASRSGTPPRGYRALGGIRSGTPMQPCLMSWVRIQQPRKQFLGIRTWHHNGHLHPRDPSDDESRPKKSYRDC